MLGAVEHVGEIQLARHQSRSQALPALRFLDEDWTVSAANTCGRCYSISFVFGHKLQGELLVPVGLMNAAVAGTGIEGWWYVAPGRSADPDEVPELHPQDRAAGRRCDARRAVVSGRGQRQAGQGLPADAQAPDRRLARRLETGGFPVLHRPARLHRRIPHRQTAKAATAARPSATPSSRRSRRSPTPAWR